jgi:predicted RNA-binding protein YlxR (DUF448 family)
MLERMCVVCRTRQSVAGMIKVTKTKDGAFSVGGTVGRGAYVCLNCVPKCVKTKALNRSFKVNVDEKVYKTLESMVKS